MNEIDKMRSDLERLQQRIEARLAGGITEDDPVIARMLGRKVELERAIGLIEQLQAEVERLQEGDKQADFTSMNLLIEKKIQIEKLEQERDQLKAILQDVNKSDYRFSVEQLAAHDADVIERMIRDHKSFFAAGNNQSLLGFAVDRINQLRQQAKEVQS